MPFPPTRHLLLLAIIALGLFAMGAGPPRTQPDLRGKITVDLLYRAFPVFRSGADAYRPEPGAVKVISHIEEKTRLVVFLGTWCLDSQSEVPALLKTLAMARNPRLELELYAVDRAMDDGIGVADQLNLQSVPTVVVFRNGREIGRIRGLARNTMESDLLDITRRPP